MTTKQKLLVIEALKGHLGDQAYIDMIRGLSNNNEEGFEQTLNEAIAILVMVKNKSPKIITGLHAAGYRKVGSKWLPLDMYLVVIDDTKRWNIKPEIMAKIEKIEGVYLFDKNSITHLCSMSGSYWLIQIEQRIIFKDNINEEEQEAIEDAIDFVICSYDDNYYNVFDIDVLLSLTTSRIYHYGNPKMDWDNVIGGTENEKYDDIIKYIRAECSQKSFI